jgi:hypothetical protein
MPRTAAKPRKRKPRIKRTGIRQSAKFLKAAKELGLDESGSFDAHKRAMEDAIDELLALKQRLKGRSS